MGKNCRSPGGSQRCLLVLIRLLLLDWSVTAEASQGKPEHY